MKKDFFRFSITKGINQSIGYVTDRINRLDKYLTQVQNRNSNSKEQKTTKATGNRFSRLGSFLSSKRSAPLVDLSTHTTDNSMNFGGDRSIKTTNITYGDKGKKKEDKKDNTLKIAAIVGGIALAMLSVIGVGNSFKNFQAAHKNFNKSLKARNALSNLQTFSVIKKAEDDGLIYSESEVLPDKTVLSGVASLIKKQAKIDTANYRKHFNYAVEFSVILSGSVALAVGGIVSSPLAMTAGFITVIAGTILLLGTWAYCRKNNQEKEAENTKIQTLLSSATANLKQFKPTYLNTKTCASIRFPSIEKEGKNSTHIPYFISEIPVGKPVYVVQGAPVPSAPPAE